MAKPTVSTSELRAYAEFVLIGLACIGLWLVGLIGVAFVCLVPGAVLGGLGYGFYLGWVGAESGVTYMVQLLFGSL